MAIIKDFVTPQGIVAKYHKIIKAEIQVNEQTVEIMVAVYATAEARDAGRSVLWHEYVRIPFAALTQDPRDLLYPLLAYYNSSYLKDGLPDAEGSAAPGVFTINLTPDAIAPVVVAVPEPVIAQVPVVDPVPPPPVEPAPAPAPAPAADTPIENPTPP